ncbi:MBL fold metallo-hydrolase [Haloarcula marismortui]|uniref:ATP-binding protein PhnP n=1 Tax=Haloarcula marismortui ATCC 33799 TaxID=662475 RepID=M0L0I8_9EURY|nr:MBL fold metallo-hydrolase [Haloarcula californiae]EMA25505.1 ATP-binding protein PhnP [Haloarcula californiae ATCC 33799]
MEVTLLGTGDTTGTPTVQCDCDTCERARDPDEELRASVRERGIDPTGGVERSRFSVAVENDTTGESLLVDLSPDFRHQFLRESVPLPDAAIITHIHFDHLDGLGNAYRLFDELPVHAADETDPVTDESVAEAVRSRYDYLDTVSVHAQTPLEPFTVAGFEVTLVPVTHPPLLCYGLRIEEPQTGAVLSISGDTCYDVPDRSKSVLTGADLALVEGIVHPEACEYHPKGGTHHNEDGVPRTFGTKHMTLPGARDFAADIEADDYRIVHTAHYVPADRAFADDIGLDGEQFTL